MFRKFTVLTDIHLLSLAVSLRWYEITRTELTPVMTCMYVYRTCTHTSSGGGRTKAV